MTQFHGSQRPLPFLRTELLQNGAEAAGEVISVYAGNTRFMHEWLTGILTDGNPPCAPITPQSVINMVRPGHDHSGGVYGVPIAMTLWSMLLGNSNDQKNAANATGGNGPRVRVTAGVQIVPLVDNIIIPWVPNCTVDGCFNDAKLIVVAYMTASAKLRIRFENGGMVVDTTTAALGTGVVSTSLSTRVRLYPGKLQSSRILIEARYNAATSDVSLAYAALLQNRTTSP